MRWDELKVEEQQRRALPGFKDDAVVRTFNAPEAMDIRFYEIRAKSALNRVPEGSRMPFRWTINPYRGCTHACRWCFARPTHNYLDLNAREDFEREIVVKVNAPELVRRELARPSWQGEHVAMGTNTDPYQWVEGRYRLMPGIWEAMRDFANPCSVLTKSPLVVRDKKVLQEVNEVAPVTVSFSVPTLEEKAWRSTEPHTPHPRARLEAIAELTAAGIATGILIAPLMPGINDSPEQVEEIVRIATEAGAVSIGGIALHLRGEVRDIWFDWLRAKRPDLLPMYEEIYRRGAYATKDVQDRMRALIGSSRTPARRSRFLRDADEVRERNASAARERREAARAAAGGRPPPAQPSLF